MAPKRKLIPPLRPNADGTGFVRTTGAKSQLQQPRSSAPRSPPGREQQGEGRQRSESGGGRPRRAGRGAAEVSRRPERGRGAAFSSSRSSSEVSSSGSTSASSASSSLPRRGVGAGRAAPQAPAAAAKTHTDPHVVATRESKQSSQQHGTSSMTSSNRLQSSPTAAAASRANFGLVVDAGALASECRASPAVLRRLGAGNGSILRVTAADPQGAGAVGGGSVAYLEVCLSTGAPRDALCVAEETKSVLLSTGVGGDSGEGKPTRPSVEVSATVLRDASVPYLTSVQVRAFVDTESGHVAAHFEERELAGIGSSGEERVQWRALFRHAFRSRLVFNGLRTMLRAPSAHHVVFEVTGVSCGEPAGCEAPAAFGVLSTGTEIVVEGGCGAVETVVEGGSGLVARPDAVHRLVVGEPGTGKSFYLAEEAAALRSSGRRKVVVVSVESVAQGEQSEVASATALREVFAAAKRAQPATVLIDDLHLICGAKGAETTAAGSEWAVALVVAALNDEMRSIAVGHFDVEIVAAAPAREDLDVSLLTEDRLGGHVVQLLPPGDASERVVCLQRCIHDLCGAAWFGATAGAETLIGEVAAHTHGYTQRDLHRVVEAAMMASFRRGTPSTTFTGDDLRGATKTVHPSALRQFEVSVPDVTWDDIGGSETAKRTLQEVVEWCLGKESWVFRDFNLTPPKGVLLYGPPGCSKTMLAKALANESKMNFISVKGPEVFSKWVGDSEKAVRDIFSRARAAAPCVVFIDELDGMCGHRGRGGVSDRVISQFLTELDGLPSAFNQATSGAAGRSDALVFLAATNRPDNIDGAVLRPGRIDRRVHVGLPSLAEREAIVRIQFKRLPTEEGLTPSMVAQRTEGYTGAEVVAVVKEAAFSAISHDVAAEHITVADIERALVKVRPRVNQKDVEWYKHWPHNTTP